MNENFGTLKDLYNRVLPALKSKVKEMKQSQISFVSEKDVWDCLRKNKWREETDLTLYDIVNDILFIDEKEIINYVSEKRQKEAEMEMELSKTNDTTPKSAIENQNEEDTLL